MRSPTTTGKIALTTNVVGYMAELYRALEQTLRRLGADDAVDAVRAQESHRATRASLERRIEAAGYRITRVVEDAFTWRFADGTALFTHWFIRMGFLPGWRDAVPPGDRERVFSALEGDLNDRAAAAGALSLTIPTLYLEAERPGGAGPR